MPLAYLVDENQRGPLWRAIQGHNAVGAHVLDAVRVGDLMDLPLGTLDPDLLIWTERESRILVSFDRTTLPVHFADHLALGRHSPGMFLIRRRANIAQVVDFLAVAAYASDAYEWQDRIEYIG